jgi:hypothetical protein
MKRTNKQQHVSRKPFHPNLTFASETPLRYSKWIVYIGEACKRNCYRNRQRQRQGQGQQHEIVHALATLGNATKIETILSVSCRPRWPMEVLFHVAVVVAVTSVIA